MVWPARSTFTFEVFGKSLPAGIDGDVARPVGRGRGHVEDDSGRVGRHPTATGHLDQPRAAGGEPADARVLAVVGAGAGAGVDEAERLHAG